MHKLNLLIILTTSLITISCANNRGDKNDGQPLNISNDEYANVEQRILSENADTLLEFPDSYPVGVRVFGNNIIIKTAKSDSCITIYDKSTLTQKWKTGVEGQGPQDVITPDFYASFIATNTTQFQMIDVSGMSNLLLNLDTKTLTKTKLPDYIGWSSTVNMLEQYTIGARNTMECMFYIYDKNTQYYSPITYDIDCGEKVRNKVGDISTGYLLSAQTYANQSKSRIIVPHYFFDTYSVYDFSGKLLKTICLSSKEFNAIDASNKLLDNKSYIGYVAGYATADACYLIRAYFPHQSSSAEYKQLLKIDWDGIPLVAYLFNSNIVGQFYVDDNENLYAISHDDTEDEIYYLLRWSLIK